MPGIQERDETQKSGREVALCKQEGLQLHGHQGHRRHWEENRSDSSPDYTLQSPSQMWAVHDGFLLQISNLVQRYKYNNTGGSLPPPGISLEASIYWRQIVYPALLRCGHCQECSNDKKSRWVLTPTNN